MKAASLLLLVGLVVGGYFVLGRYLSELLTNPAATRGRGDTRADGSGRQAQEEARGAELEARLRALTRCKEGKVAAARDLIRGRLKLLAAAARFRDLQQSVPGYPWEGFRRAYPGDSEEERLCRAVIGYVGDAVRDEPGADPNLVRRLEAELQGHLRRGPLRLSATRDPGVPPAPGQLLVGRPLRDSPVQEL
jgi:hypothetical protein